MKRPAVPTVVRRPDGRSVRWAEHRIARRDELIDAAIMAIRRHGATAGMDQIAAAAGTSKPVIYRYFVDKADLYRAVVARAATDLLDRLVAALDSVTDPREATFAGIDAFLSRLDEDPELYKFVVNHPSVERAADDVVHDYASAIAAVITGQLAQRLAAAGRDPARAIPGGVAIVGFIRAAGDWWVDHHQQDMTRAELTEYLTSLLWGGAAGIYALAGLDVDSRPPEHVFPAAPAGPDD